jgi:hypothetical protein
MANTKARNLADVISGNFDIPVESLDNAVVDSAADVPYDNTTSGISANNLQEAIDYLNIATGGGSAGAQATYTRDGFTATEGQTTFTTSNGYTLGYVQVFMNGVMLDLADYTANNESTVVLGTGARAGDEIVVIAYDSFAISEVLRALDISPSAPNDALKLTASGGVYIGTSGSTAAGFADDLVISKPVGNNTGITVFSNSSNVGSYIFGNELDADVGGIRYYHDNHHMRFNTGGVEAARVSDSGLSFDSGSNYLDSYEEGTFELDLYAGGAKFMDISCSYTKIGDRVFISGERTNTSQGATGAVSVVGSLPFTPSQDSMLAVAGNLRSLTIANQMHFAINSGSTTLRTAQADGANRSNLLDAWNRSATQTACYISIQGNYRTS